jgi:hypothetical protein
MELQVQKRKTIEEIKQINKDEIFQKKVKEISFFKKITKLIGI